MINFDESNEDNEKRKETNLFDKWFSSIACIIFSVNLFIVWVNLINYVVNKMLELFFTNLICLQKLLYTLFDDSSFYTSTYYDKMKSHITSFGWYQKNEKIN